MILYFSATGNNKYIAESIASSIHDECKSIVDCMHEGQYHFAHEKVFGIVVPTYFWSLPHIVRYYLEKLRFDDCCYTFFLASYGTTTGMAGKMAESLVKFDAYYSVIMPDTWTPVFNLTNTKRVEKWLNEGNKQLDHVIKQIQLRSTGNFIDRKIPACIAKIPSHYMYLTERKTHHLSVKDDLCIGCGLCARKCPIGAIEMKEKRPVWKEKECEMCLGCLHRCPKFAISYKGKTQKHGQYKNPYTNI